MRILNALACLVALIIGAGEVARFWGDARFVPMALDELAVAAGLLWAVWRSSRDGAVWHVAAWGLFSGLSLVLLVDTADHQLHGPAKAAGPIYLSILGAMLTLGIWAILRSVRMVRARF